MIADTAGQRVGTPQRVLIVQRRLTHYRVPFFEALRRELASHHIELVLACGDPTEAEAVKQDEGYLPWAHHLMTRYFMGGRICWQSFHSLAKQCDLVVITHENKLVFNLVAQYLLLGRKVALWGHGANLHGDPGSLRERFKKHTAAKADWWFGYTDYSTPHIRQAGFPPDRITVLNNSIDTEELSVQLAGVTSADKARVREQLGLAGGPVGLYLGSLYSEKRIGFLLEASAGIREMIPGFELVVVGAGPDAGLVQAFCAANSWAHYAGVKTGRSKAEVLAIADVLLNPSMVGLGILDAFVAGVPMVTTDCGRHGPEIAYLDNGRNGLMTSDTLSDYVNGVVKLLSDPEYKTLLGDGCRQSAKLFTVANMAHHFRDGVMKCLAMPAFR